MENEAISSLTHIDDDIAKIVRINFQKLDLRWKFYFRIELYKSVKRESAHKKKLRYNNIFLSYHFEQLIRMCKK